MYFLQNVACCAFLVLVGWSHALALPDSDWEVVHPSNLFPREPFDVSRYASLGESYASGPSAGDSYDDTKCRRYKKAFGPQVAEDERIHGPKPIDFSFIACSGSRTWHIYQDRPDGKVKQSQAGQLKDKNPDMVTLSIGGNDIGFATLLDRCVYRFYQSHINACRGCHWFWSDDCTNDCKAAMEEVEKNIDGSQFASDLTSAIKAIFDVVPRTKLFITGYPEFWNDKTDYCDSVSFKLNCPNNWVLPLTKERRRGMNYLTWKLNAKIQTIIKNWPTRADIHYVDTNSRFGGHRFCEEGVREPSYRNPNIWFYPLEYTTNGQSVKFDGRGENVPSGDCNAILQDGDQGEYFTCLMANGVLDNNTSIDLANMTNNVAGDGEVAIKSGGDLPDWIARVFHPNINGMSAYKEAIIQAYNDYKPASIPSSSPPAGKSLSIAMITIVNSHFGGATVDSMWHFYITKTGHAVDCNEDSDLVEEITPHDSTDPTLSSDVDIKQPPWPGGSYKLNIDGQECEYKCDGTNPGRLFCPEREIACKEDSQKSNSDGTKTCGSSRATFHAVVYCDF